jgi:hypothetical protein
MKLNSIQVLLALTTKYDFKIHYLDVKTFFFNGYFEE